MEDKMMSTHPIEGLMKVAMENIKEMVDVNTIVGDPVETADGSVIMPISKVGFGFAAGGSEFGTQTDMNGSPLSTRNDAMNAQVSLPFGGGSGGGVSITPIAFLVVGSSGVKVIPLDNQTHIFERIIDSVPQVVEKIQSMLQGMGMGGSSTASSGMMMSGGSSTTTPMSPMSSTSTTPTTPTTGSTSSSGSSGSTGSSGQNYIV
jgi:sporulation protein YtfJ